MKLVIRALMASSLLVGSVIADDFGSFTMDFANIGAAGNAADGTGYGAVSYNYRIGKFEVTIDQFVKSGVGSGNENTWVGIGTNAPATRVNWHEAARFSNWLTTGNQNLGAYSISNGLVTAVDRSAAVLAYGTVYVLPTVDEFYKAAYFDATGGLAGYSTYADGSSVTPTAGTEVNYNATINQPWLVGSGFDEQNGTKDMMGNVWEWLESLPSDNDPTERAISGGSYLTDAVSIRNIGSRPGFALGTEGTQLGLRIVAIPEPGTISLMSLSTISLFFTRTMRRRKLAGRSLLPVRQEHFCDAYCSLGEWEASFEEEDSPDLFDALREMFLPSLRSAWGKVHDRYKALDRVFWNRMVVTYESHTVAKRAFKKAFKKNTLACFDGFLSLFMR